MFSTLPTDYSDRVYAGVLGKVIGVYLGRPFEQWSRLSIEEKFGDINYYVHERAGVPLVVADDDVSGTFTFLRALEDNDFDPNLTSEQIGETWLNYIIENRTILWWGGRSTSTEHTAYLNLKNGIKAPRSGSMELNGKIVGEQIGAQIFIDGWGLIHPNDPEAAADWARRAASVSHDGEAIFGAQVIAAMVAGAFGEADIYKLQDLALAQIPQDCLIRRLIDDVRELVARKPDWREGFQELDERYGYYKYGGGCHIIPNHGLIHFALLHGKGDFQDSMRVVNTCGWDTDCNAGNLGCILGVRGGLETFEGGPDWRGPFADRVIIPTADGGGYATTASALTERIVRSATRLRKGSISRSPRFNFALRDSVQGFQIDPRFESRNLGMISNDDGRMRIDFNRVATGNRFEFWTPTFIIPSDLATSGYGLYASPNLYSGQEVTCEVQLAPDSSGPVDVWLKGWRYGRGDEPESVTIGTVTLKPGANQTLNGVVPQPGWKPYFGIGFEIGSRKGANGALNVSNLDWNSPAKTTLSGPDHPGKLWLQQWVNGLSELRDWSGMDCVQNEGTGLATIGCREWQNYQASAKIQILGSRQAGIAVHVQGMRRYYALVLEPGVAKFIKSRDGVRELGSAPFAWAFDEIHDLKIEVQTLADSVLLKGWVDGELLIEATDSTRPLAEGAIGILVTEGRARPESVSIASLNQV